MTTDEYRYDECGLENVVLKGLRIQTADDGEETVTIPRINLLHRLLVEAVAEKHGRLTPKELRFLRTEMEMTQGQLAELVHRDVQSIGRWERGETPIDSAAETLIRALALEQVVTERPTIRDVSGWTVLEPSDEPYMIDARDPEHYQRMAA